MNKEDEVSERNKRFRYETDDLQIITNQCNGCIYNLNKTLECKQYKRIPNGTRSGKLKCKYREGRKIE